MKKITMLQAIKEFLSKLPGGEFSTGCYVYSVGHKWVTYVNTWGGIRQEKISLDDFYETYIK